VKRTPEPELMDAPEQARAYADADFSEPNRLFLFHFLKLLDEQPGDSLIDLGCGPGDICIRLAQALPGWQVVGLDAGPNMLALAAEAVAREGLDDQIELVLARLPDELPVGRYDAITSNSLLHHLPDPMSLWQSIAELAAPGTLVQVMDLKRPASRESASAIVDEHAADAPEVLREDFFNSLLAAYTSDEVRAQIAASGLAGLELSEPTNRHWLVQGRVRAR
jgi:cyclopropane fatty-acyl-phospholipid synthase-like methyltransferase